MRRRLATLGLGAVLGLAAVEAASRVFALAPPLAGGFGSFVGDPHLPFKRKPLSRLRGREPEFDYDYRHNRAGFRDVEHEITKPGGTFRILGLGDSFTYGVGVTFEESYLFALEQALARRPGPHPPVEIIKAGVPRYFPEPERLLLEHYGLAYRPDLVLVGVSPNDVVDTHLGIGAVTVDRSGALRSREADRFGALGALAYRHSHAARILLRATLDLRLRPRHADLFRSGGVHEPDWLRMEAEYGRMAELAASVGARLVLVHIPQKGPWTERNRYMPRRLRAWAEQHAVSFLDVLPAMEGHPEPASLHHRRDGHCTATGHTLIAATLLHFLTEKSLVP